MLERRNMRKSEKMSFLSIIIIVFFALLITSTDLNQKTALIIIDIQDFYFPGGSLPLINPEIAAENAKKILIFFRDQKLPVIHVRHKSSKGFGIYRILKPVPGEKIVTKTEVNGFKGTGLKLYLDRLKIESLVICGMQTQMCVEGIVRAASDYGFKVTLIADACATRDLKYNEILIPSKLVQASTLKTIDGIYAEVVTTSEFLKKFIKK